jgi:hypothetical protein
MSNEYKLQFFRVFVDCWKCLPSDRYQLEMIVLNQIGGRHLSPGDRVQVSLMCRAWQEWAYCLSQISTTPLSSPISEQHQP